MTLENLLKQITPLPWNEGTSFAVDGVQYWSDQAYRHHAANLLPELVKALEEQTKRTGQLAGTVNRYADKLGLGNKIHADDWTDEARQLLTRANEIKL